MVYPCISVYRICRVKEVHRGRFELSGQRFCVERRSEYTLLRLQVVVSGWNAEVEYARWPNRLPSLHAGFSPVLLEAVENALHISSALA
jgi:hypothetical protein